MQIAKGLCHVHASSVVHRDVKPDNILLRRGVWRAPDGDVLLAVADFGESIDCAHQRGFQVSTGLVNPGGAAAFNAPEVRLGHGGDGIVDYSKQDAWALGYLMYMMLSPDPAAAPFPGGDPRTYRDDQYVPPGDATAAFGGVSRAEQAAAARIVRGLLTVDHGARGTLESAVAQLEVALFVLPGCAPGGGGLGAVRDRLTALREHFVGTLAGSPVSVASMLLVDFLHSPRSAPDAVAAVLRGLAR